MAYINKEEIRQAIEQLKNETDTIGILVGINRVGSAIASLPTADVVEVVRCKDCKHWSRVFGCYRIKKSLFNLPFEANGFCSYGERK